MKAIEGRDGTSKGYIVISFILVKIIVHVQFKMQEETYFEI